MRQPLVAGNWKMNGSRDGVRVLLDGVESGMGEIANAEVAVCPPYPFLQMCQEALAGSRIQLGAQNLCAEESGAYTGEVAGSMLVDFGCKYVIIGHSERRQYYGETDELIARKYRLALSLGLTPILCVGESLLEREGGETEAVVARHVDAVLEGAGVAALAAGVIAYEPVWAIGTGKTATPEQAQDVHAFIRGRVAAKDAGVAAGLRILYGGSMKPGNAAELTAKPDIDGGLIGGAALKAADFLAICKAADANA